MVALPARHLALSQTPGSNANVNTGEIRIHVKDPSGRPVQAQGTLLGLTVSPQTINFQVRSATPLDREVLLIRSGVSTTVTVIASNPIGTLEVPIADVPVPVQTLTSRTIEDTNAIDLTDVMKKRLNGVPPAV